MSPGTDDLDEVTRTPARFVRMYGTSRVMERYGYSLWELEIR